MLNREYAVIDGKDSRDFGVYLIDGNVFDAPEADYEFVQIPGRTGDLTISHNRWKNIEITYKFAAYNNAIEKLNKWKAFLLAVGGNRKIEISVDPGHFRQGVISGNISPVFSWHHNGGGYMEVTFNCSPKRFLTSGTVGIEIPCDTSGRAYMQIANPTRYEARPIFVVKAHTPGYPDSKIKINNNIYYHDVNDYVLYGTRDATTIQITSATPTITIDCETRAAYEGANNRMNYINLDSDDFPSLIRQYDSNEKYLNTYDIVECSTLIETYYMDSVTLIPNWWTI